MTQTLRIGLEPIQKPGQSFQSYGTPWPLIRAVERRFGPLTIDLAATRHNAKAPKWITPEEDSLKQNWAERIGDGLAWLNPPFADIDPWARKCKEAGETSRVIVLTPASIGSEWFAENCEDIAAVIGLRPRICFEGCHQLYPAKHPKAGQRRCDDACLGCATYPKDCMLTVFGDRRTLDGTVLLPFQTWRWA